MYADHEDVSALTSDSDLFGVADFHEDEAPLSIRILFSYPRYPLWCFLPLTFLHTLFYPCQKMRNATQKGVKI